MIYAGVNVMASAAPHDLDLVIDYVNTLDLETGVDSLATRDGLAKWLADRGLRKPAVQQPRSGDREEAIRLREALRALMLEHNGGPHDERAAGVLERAARRGELGIHFASDGTVNVQPGNDAFAGALAALLVPVARAAADGSWQRVKACRADDCRWAFYDRSRNRAGTWCDMTVCGNRTKVRAYRERATQGP